MGRLLGRSHSSAETGGRVIVSAEQREGKTTFQAEGALRQGPGVRQRERDGGDERRVGRLVGWNGEKFRLTGAKMGGDPPTRSLQAAWGVRGLPLPRPVISWLERGKSASCFWSALPFGKRFCTCFSPVMTSRRAGAVNTAEGRGSVMPSD